jgi:hypothetical protein
VQGPSAPYSPQANRGPGQHFTPLPGEVQVQQFFSTTGIPGLTAKFVAGIVLLVLFIALPMIAIGDAAAASGSAIGIALVLFGILIIIGVVYWAYSRHKNSSMILGTDVLTNLRAVVVSSQGVIQAECPIAPDVICIVSNVVTHTRGTQAAGGGSSYGQSTQVGNVTFMRGGAPLAIFENIPDPQGVMNTVQAMIRSQTAAAYGAPGGAYPAGPQPGPQFQTWSFSPPK